MQKKDHNHQGHHDHLLGQRPFECIDGTPDQIGTIIGRHDLDTFGQGGTNLVDALLDPIDDRKRVLAIAHHHDPADRLPVAIELGHAPP